jgi:hypothetical protein
VMGRYYSRHDGDLYIYVTKNDPMVDLSLFPRALKLFDYAEPRSMNGKIVVVKGAAERNVNKAEIILSLNGFKKRNISREILEQYYDSGDEAVLDGEDQLKGDTEARDSGNAVDGEEMEVIIPRAESPTLGYNEDEREKDQDGPEAPSDEAQRAHESRKEDQGADQGRIPISEEELVDSFVLWMRSQGIQIEKELEASKTEPTVQVQDELVEVLNEAMRAKKGSKPTPRDEASMDDLLREMAAYVIGKTPMSQEMERPKTALEELLEHVDEPLKSRSQLTEEEIQRVPIQGPFSIEEEIDRYIVEYIKSRFSHSRAEDGHEPQIWIEGELDRHIAEYIKSRMPIPGSKSMDHGKAQTDEVDKTLNLLRLSEKANAVKIKEKGQFPPEIVKLLSERLRKENKES